MTASPAKKPRCYVCGTRRNCADCRKWAAEKLVSSAPSPEKPSPVLEIVPERGEPYAYDGAPPPGDDDVPTEYTKPTPAARPQRVPPHDLAAERALVGAVLLLGDEVRSAVHVAADDFFNRACSLVWIAADAVIGRGEPVDLIAVADELRREGHLAEVGAEAGLLELQGACPAPSKSHVYSRIVTDHAAARRSLAHVQEALDAAYATDLAGVAKAAEGMAARCAVTRVVEPSRDLDEFLSADEPEYRWAIPNLLERQDRVILTATEGAGKSTFLRQIGVQAASGIHPFTHEDIEPVRVMLLDLENSESQVRRLIRPLRSQAGERYQPGHLRIECRPQGLNLLDSEDRAWLEEKVSANAPDIIVGGPIYKMADGDPSDEKSAKPVAAALDHIRTTYDTAIWLEAHSGHAQGQSTKRPERPFGWSGWMRWPEFGIYLSDQGYLNHWRGARDADRPWPAALKRGGEWPWTVETDKRSITFARIMDETRAAGRKLPLRDLAAAIAGDAGAKNTIDRAIKANQQQYDALIQELEN